MTNDQSLRRLVTLEEVADVQPIPDADAIERARVRGWDVVVRKGEVHPGDVVLYFEIDAALPLEDPRFAFLEPRGRKVLEDGTAVHVLKTARLRGQYSQGLVIPMDLGTRSQIFQYLSTKGYSYNPVTAVEDVDRMLGVGVSEALSVTKYEPRSRRTLPGRWWDPSRRIRSRRLIRSGFRTSPRCSPSSALRAPGPLQRRSMGPVSRTS